MPGVSRLLLIALSILTLMVVSVIMGRRLLSPNNRPIAFIPNSAMPLLSFSQNYCRSDDAGEGFTKRPSTTIQPNLPLGSLDATTGWQHFDNQQHGVQFQFPAQMNVQLGPDYASTSSRTFALNVVAPRDRHCNKSYHIEISAYGPNEGRAAGPAPMPTRPRRARAASARWPVATPASPAATAIRRTVARRIPPPIPQTAAAVVRAAPCPMRLRCARGAAAWSRLAPPASRTVMGVP